MMDKTADEVRSLLTEFCTELRALKFPTSPISVGAAEFVADAFERYISNEVQTLDAAFDLTPRKGRPKNEEKRESDARKMAALLSAGKSWDEVADGMARFEGDQPDKRTLRRLHKDYETKFMAEELTRRLERRGKPSGD